VPEWQLQSIFQEELFSHRKRAICLLIQGLFAYLGCTNKLSGITCVLTSATQSYL